MIGSTPSPSRGAGWLAWGVPAGFVAAAGVAAAGTPSGPVLCPWRSITGTPCPGCGTTRAAASLLRGDLAVSWDHHPLVLLLAVQAVVLAALVLLPPPRRLAPPLVAAGVRPLAAVDVVLAVALWLFRLATGATPGA